MQPEPAIMAELDRLVDRQRFGAAVAMQTKRPHESGNDRRDIRCRADKLSRLSHADPTSLQPNPGEPLLAASGSSVQSITPVLQFDDGAPPYSAASPVAAWASLM